MTRATYNTDNTLTELPGMERPKRPFAANYDNQYDFNLDLQDYQNDLYGYNTHLSSLRTLVCSPECRGLWKEGQVLEEGKDYEVAHEYIGQDVGDIIAFPLPVKSEDDLWYKAIDLIMVAHDKGLSKEDAVGVVKSQFIITKR